jgi:GNAT superfamily N-acetyltransferase
MSIRNVEVSDKVAITELAKKCAPFLRPSVIGTYEFLARCFRNTFFVYEENKGVSSKILGFIVGFPNTDVQGEFWIYQACLCKKCRSKGIGSLLFERLLQQVKSEGYTSVRSHFKFDNAISKKLHEKFGIKIYDQDDRGWFAELIL